MKRKFGVGALGLVFFLFFPFCFAAWAEGLVLERPMEVERLGDGNTLVTDGGGRSWELTGSRVIEVNSLGEIIWEFSENLVFAHTAKRLNNGHTLIVNTGRNYLLEVNEEGEAVWTSKEWPEGKLKDGSQLAYPNDLDILKNGRWLVTDRNNDRVVEIDQEGKIYWQKTGLARPHNADRLADGSTLISDSEGNRVIRVNSSGEVIWSYGQSDSGPLYWPRDADWLDNGNYLITDARHHRVVVVSPEGKEVWEASGFLSFPYEADGLTDGHVLIADSSHARVIEVNEKGEIAWQLGDFSPLFFSQFLNGSFEKDKNGDEWPDEWLKGELMAEGKGELGWDKVVFKDGERSLRLENEGGGMVFGHQYWQVKPGRKYRLSGWVKTQEVTGQARLEIIFLDELGGQVGLTARTADLKGSEVWTKLETEFRVPPEAAAIDLWTLLDGPGTAWFDKISLNKGFLGSFLSWPLILGLFGGLGAAWLASQKLKR